MTALLTSEADTYPFEGLISRSFIASRSTFTFLLTSTAQYVISILLLNLMVMTEVIDMVWLVNEPF